MAEATEAPAKPQLRRELFVRSLPASATTEKLTEFFSQSYVLKHATVVLDPETKQSKGYGFVTFADIEDAERALEEFNGAEFEGKKIKVEVAQPRKREIDENRGKSVPTAESAKLKEDRLRRREQAQPPKLIVRNLPWTIKDSDQLAALFRSFGKVKYADLPKRGNLQAGFGFVVLRGRKNAEKALEAVNGKEVDGRTLAVDWAVDKNVWQEAQQSAEQKADDDAMDVDGIKTSPTESPSDKDDAEYGDEVDLESDEDDEGSVDEDDEEEILEEEEAEEEEDERNACTIFIRNLPFTSSDETLYEHFKQFGPLRYARIVVDPETERPRGTGFVCFWNTEDAVTCVKDAPKQIEVGKEDGSSKKNATSIKQSVLQNDMLDPSGKYTMDDRVLIVSRAVSRSQANRLTEEGVSRRSERDKDKRRLYLLTEGTIASNSSLYKKLAPSEVKMREDSLKQRQNMIKNNPTLHLSFTRLSIRNIPRSVTSKDLKALAREAIVGFAKDVKEGRRQPLSAEELSRGSDETKEDDKRRREKGKGLVKQAKIVFEGRDGSKIEEKTGAGRSRGYGFVEYFNHRHALMGLRWLNGHVVQAKSTNDGEAEKKKRLIVEFAIENAQVVKRRREFQDKARSKQEDGDKKGREAHRSNQKGTKRKRFEGRDNKEDKKETAGEDDDDEKNRIAKRNRIISRKRQQRKQRKGKA